MIQRTVTITHEHGLHARPAASFVKVATGFNSSIMLRNISRGGPAVNAKSIMQVLTAGVNQGSSIELLAEGEDAQQAVDALVDLLNQDS